MIFPKGKAHVNRYHFAQTCRLGTLFKVGLGAATILILCGCHSVGSFAGWATLGSSTLQGEVTACTARAGTAKLCRNSENALDVSISPIRVAGQLQSWSYDQYRVQLTFRAAEPFTGSSALLIPLLHFSAFQDPVVMFDSDQKRVFISLLASSLGVDLLGATLMSPGGIRGAIVSSDAKAALELDARFAQTGEAVGKVWVSKSGDYALVESRVEYSVLWSVGRENQAPVAFTLAPFARRWVRVCNGCDALSADVQYSVVPIPTVPQLTNWVKQGG